MEKGETRGTQWEKNEKEKEKEKKRNIIHAAQQGVRLSPVFRTASLKRSTAHSVYPCTY